MQVLESRARLWERRVIVIQSMGATMSNSKISLDDLLAAQSSVLTRIARDLEELDDRRTNMAHNSTTSGHNSSGTHTSHTSGVSSAAKFASAADAPSGDENT